MVVKEGDDLNVDEFLAVLGSVATDGFIIGQSLRTVGIFQV